MYMFCFRWVLCQPAVLPPGNNDGTSSTEEILTHQPQPAVRYPDPNVEGSGTVQLIMESVGCSKLTPLTPKAGDSWTQATTPQLRDPCGAWGQVGEPKEGGSGGRRKGREEKESEKGRKELKGSKNTLTRRPVNTHVHSSTNSQSPECGSNPVSTNG